MTSETSTKKKAERKKAKQEEVADMGAPQQTPPAETLPSTISLPAGDPAAILAAVFYCRETRDIESARAVMAEQVDRCTCNLNQIDYTKYDMGQLGQQEFYGQLQELLGDVAKRLS